MKIWHVGETYRSCYTFILEFHKKVKLSLCLGTQMKLHTLLTSTQNGGERPASHFGWKEGRHFRLTEREILSSGRN